MIRFGLPAGADIVALQADFLYKPGLPGGQSAFGGTANTDDLTFAANTLGTGAGRVRMNSPMVLGSYSATNAAYAFDYTATETFNALFIGGGMNFSPTVTANFTTFIYESFRAAPIITSGVAFGFSAYTLMQALPQFRSGAAAAMRPLSPVILNAAPRVVNQFAGTRITPNMTGCNISPVVQTEAVGAIMTVTDSIGYIFSPLWNTLSAGSTVNLGQMVGLDVRAPSVVLFGSSLGTERGTSFYGVQVANPTINNGFGTMPVAAIRSTILNGTNRYFLLNAGTAPSDMGAAHMYFDDNFGVAYGGAGVTNFDAWQSWQAGAVNKFRTFFINNSGSIYMSGPDTNRYLIEANTGNGEFNFNCAKFSLGSQAGANGNSIGQFVAGARATTVNGGWVDFSFSQAGSLTIDHAMSDVAGLNMAGISLIIGTGSIAGYITTFSVGMTTSGVTGVETSAIRPTGRIHHRGVMELPPLEPAQITADQNNYSPATFNNMRQMWRLTSDAAWNITGILIPTSNNPADTQWIVNAGSFDITLTHQDGASTASNRFISPTGLDYVLSPTETVALWHDPTTDRWRILWGSEAHLERSIHLSGQQFRKGATAPTDVTIGTTPTVGALHFDATNELASLYHSYPNAIDTSQDIILRLQFSLSSIETNGDTCDFTCDYTAITLAGGGGIAKTSTQVTGQFTAVTGRLAVGDIYEMDITFPAGDATNPLPGSDGIAFEIHLTNTTGVGDIDLLDGDFVYTALR
jgi:hypothetical protein